jgi:predicted transcriptional regulator
MDISKKQLEESIIKVSVYIREDRSYEELLKITTLPEICKKIAYDLFIRNVTESNAMNDTDVFTSIIMIRKYCQALARDGFFDFKSDIPGHGGL